MYDFQGKEISTNIDYHCFHVSSFQWEPTPGFSCWDEMGSLQNSDKCPSSSSYWYLWIQRNCTCLYTATIPTGISIRCWDNEKYWQFSTWSCWKHGVLQFKRIVTVVLPLPSSNLTSSCPACIYESILRLWNAYVDWWRISDFLPVLDLYPIH